MTQREISRLLPELKVIWDRIIVEDCWKEYRGYRLTYWSVDIGANKTWPSAMLVCHMDNSPLHPDDSLFVDQPLNLLDDIPDSPAALAQYLNLVAVNSSVRLQQWIDKAYTAPTEVPRPFSEYA